MTFQRIVIENLRPSTPTGRYPAKVTSGERFEVTADIYREGHDVLTARVRWKSERSRAWKQMPMVPRGNDRWSGEVFMDDLGAHTVVVEAWTDLWETFRRELRIKFDAGSTLGVELEEGADLLRRAARTAKSKKDRTAIEAALANLMDDDLELEQRVDAVLDPGLAELMSSRPHTNDLTRSKSLPIWVDRPRAMTAAWYEMFPRSEGGFEGATKRLHAIAEMGFDIVYLPPIHPIGETHRKGRNNTLDPGPEDPGSPWAIGSKEGGHTAIHPDLGSEDDLRSLISEAESLGMEVALDYALQCSPDHPWVSEHPEWFHHRPDGSIKHAENPPKKYQDIYPINFWPDQGREELWQACKQIIDHWMGFGIKVFRVDNPHTKPFAFWEWLIAEVQREHPEVIFLSEAFTRPKIMSKLAEIGFTQSYTYFTWRTNGWELREYVTEVALGPKADYMRPNFWPNTPDILSGPLRNGNPAAFKMRFVLAATMAASYGIYSGYELMENQPASESNEEYLNSEKYEIRDRNWDDPRSIAGYIAQVNAVRRKHPALQRLTNITFHHSANDQVIAYSKRTGDDVVLMAVNLDPYHPHETTLWLDLEALGISGAPAFDAYDELTGEVYTWRGPEPYIRLDPLEEPAHILHIRPHASDPSAYPG